MCYYYKSREENKWVKAKKKNLMNLGLADWNIEANPINTIR